MSIFACIGCCKVSNTAKSTYWKDGRFLCNSCAEGVPNERPDAAEYLIGEDGSIHYPDSVPPHLTIIGIVPNVDGTTPTPLYYISYNSDGRVVYKEPSGVIMCLSDVCSMIESKTDLKVSVKYGVTQPVLQLVTSDDKVLNQSEVLRILNGERNYDL